MPGEFTPAELWDRVAFTLNAVANLVRAHRSIVTGADVVILLLNTVQKMITQWAHDGAAEGAMRVKYDEPHGLHVWLETDGERQVPAARSEDDEGDDEGDSDSDDDREPALNTAELAMYVLAALTDIELAQGSVHLALRAANDFSDDAKSRLDRTRAEAGESLDALWSVVGHLCELSSLLTGLPSDTGLPRICVALAKVEAGEALPRGTMPPKATGNIERRGGKPYAIRVRLPDGSRKRIPLPKGCSETMAEEKRQHWGGLAAAGQLEAVPAKDEPPPDATPRGNETVAGYVKRWLAHRKAAGVRTVDDDKGRLTKHVLPIIGAKSMLDVTADDIENVRDALDDKIRDEVIAWKTALNIWTNVQTLFHDASRSKHRALRVRDGKGNPCADIEAPDRGEKKGSTALYPSEFLKFVTCEKVPLRWRRLVTLNAYLGRRSGEIRALTCGDVDLEHQRVSLTKAAKDNRAPVATTKTKRSGNPEIEPALLPLLTAMVAGREPAERLTWSPAKSDQSPDFRAWLLVAGVDRHELHHGTPTTRRIFFHGLRATCATWLAVRGWKEHEIMARTGHEDPGSLRSYVTDFGGVNRATYGEVFPPLPEGLWATRSGHETFSPAESGSEERSSPGVEPCCAQETATYPQVKGSATPRSAEGNPAKAGERGPAHGPTPGPREALRTALAEAIRAAVLAGDTDTVELIVDRLRALDATPVAGVVELASRRKGGGS